MLLLPSPSSLLALFFSSDQGKTFFPGDFFLVHLVSFFSPFRSMKSQFSSLLCLLLCSSLPPTEIQRPGSAGSTHLLLLGSFFPFFSVFFSLSNNSVCGPSLSAMDFSSSMLLYFYIGFGSVDSSSTPLGLLVPLKHLSTWFSLFFCFFFFIFYLLIGLLYTSCFDPPSGGLFFSAKPLPPLVGALEHGFKFLLFRYLLVLVSLETFFSCRLLSQAQS